MNPFQKIAAEKAAASVPEATTAPAEKKLVNPFSKSAKPNTADTASPAKSKLSNPFARKSAVSGTVPSPNGATPPAAASSHPLSPRTAEPAAAATGPCVTAEEFTHESQPVAYTQEQVDSLQLALANLQQAFGGRKEQIADAIRLVGSQLSQHGALCGIMKPEDWGLMVRGMRESYGVVIAKKGDKREKKAAKSADEAAAGDIIDSIEGFDF